MGQVIITFGRALTRDQDGGAQVIHAHRAQSEEMDSGAASSATTMTAAAGDFGSVCNNSDGLVWVAFGASPTAAVEATHPVRAGETREFGGLGAGDKCAVIDDS